MGAVDRDGMTLISLKLYFNERAAPSCCWRWPRARKLHDKRESEKKPTGQEKAACCGRGDNTSRL